MQSIDKVLKVAQLARLDLSEGHPADEAARELAKFSKQFDEIVALMDTLAEVDTEGVQPLYWPLSAPVAGPREDVAERHNTREELLRNAPEQDGEFFIVPRIV